MKRRVFCFISVFLCLLLMPFGCLVAFAEEDVGTNGAECFFEHADSGIVICGDSRCCQIHNYKHDYEFASFGCVWGGNYYTTNATNVIASPAHVKSVQEYIKHTVEKKGSCTVFCFATINGWGASGNDNVANIDLNHKININNKELFEQIYLKNKNIFYFALKEQFNQINDK